MLNINPQENNFTHSLANWAYYYMFHQSSGLASSSDFKMQKDDKSPAPFNSLPPLLSQSLNFACLKFPAIASHYVFPPLDYKALLCTVFFPPKAFTAQSQGTAWSAFFAKFTKWSSLSPSPQDFLFQPSNHPCKTEPWAESLQPPSRIRVPESQVNKLSIF